MSDCINCQCEDIVVGRTACNSLKKQNDDRIKLHSLVLRDTSLCDIPEQTSKAFYSQWCFNKNITSQLCWLMDNSSGGGKEYKAGKDITISADGTISFSGTIPKPTASYNDAGIKSDYNALRDDFNRLKANYAKLESALNKIIGNLASSGAWTGGIEGNFAPNRNIATGNINVFGGTPDGSAFIRTNSGSTENDLAGGIN